MKKVFFIGYNRTATTSFHEMFIKCGYKSIHCIARDEGHIGRIIEDNVLSNSPILKTIDNADAYSDMCFMKLGRCIEGQQYYRELYNEYPDSYFILQTRKLEDWIRSRSKHKRGDFMRRCMKFYQIRDAREMRDHWRKERTGFEAEVMQFFSLRSKARFMRYDIDNNHIVELINFLKSDFPDLNEKNFGHRNKTLR